MKFAEINMQEKEEPDPADSWLVCPHPPYGFSQREKYFINEVDFSLGETVEWVDCSDPSFI